MFSVLTQITKMYNQFTMVERRIADEIIEQPEKIVNMSVREIAEISQTSEAAIVRFSKKVGLKGIKALKVELAQELHTIKIEKISSKIENNDSIQKIKDKVFNNSIQALHNTEKIFEIDELEKAAEKMAKSKQMFIFGVGASSIVAHDLKIKLRRIDKHAEYVNDRHSAMVMMANLSEGDVAFFISTSGRTKEIIEVMKACKEKGIINILLTQNIPSPARRQADIVLSTSEEENNIRIASMTSRLAQLVIIDVLFLSLCKIIGQDAMNRILTLNNVLSSGKETI